MIKIRLASVLVLLKVSSALAGGAGTETAEFLRVSPDAQTASLGNSGVTNALSGFALTNNPALLSKSQDTFRLAAAQTQWLAGFQANHYTAAYGWTMGGRRWATGLHVSDWGSDPFETTDAFGQASGSLDFKARQMVLGLGHQVSDKLHVGGNVKEVSQSFVESGAGADSVKSNVVSWDLGAALTLARANVTLGAVLQNMGAKAESESLPQVMRLGAQGGLLRSQITWVVEASQESQGSYALKTGMSYQAFSGLSLRVGFDSAQARPATQGLTSGVGVQFKKFTLDYAMSPFNELGVTQRVSMSWRWSGSTAQWPQTKKTTPKTSGLKDINSWLR